MDYSCSECGATYCKLWRPYMGTKPLKCCVCVAREENAKEEKVNISTIDDNGTIISTMGRSDQIGWYIPAIPCDDGTGYLGYTSVPEEQVRWWRSLDTLPKGG